MKKNYMKPAVVAVNINENILAGSLGVDTEKTTSFQYHKGMNDSDYDFEYEED